MDRLCVEWQWVESGICVDPDVCVDDAQEFSLCGLNGRGESSRTCVLGQWSAWGDCNDPDECLDDDSRGCLNVCHPGHEYCVEGQWAPCDAPAPHPEICDGIDNDCNGQTDELEECLCYLQDCGGHGLCVVNNWVAACLCETDYTIDGDPLICIHEKPAPCSPNTDLIPHARDIVIDVTITFSSQDGWNTADTCDWECEPAYLLKNGACVDKCTDIDCSGHGACNAESGTATCECEEGYTPYGTECAENLPPFIPEAPYPENDAYDIPYGSRVLTWLGGDPDGDVVTYTVIIDTVLPPRKIACAAAAVESCTVSLQSGTRYFWQVTATDAGGKTVDGPLWRFKTAIDQGNPAPAWPSGSVLYAARTGSAALELRWTQAQDSGGIREYVLYNGGEPFAKIQPGQAPTVSESGQTRHSFVLMPLDPETPYDLKIEACDGNLCTNNGPSAVVTTIPMENTVKQEELLDRSAFLALIDLARAIYRPTATTEPVQHFTKADPGNDDAPMYREQVALLSGEVMDETGMPMSDVLVYVKDHPEYGYTYTRAGDDAGKWDLVVNGGPTYILVFYRSGYLSVQRAVTTTGNMSNTITRVVLIEEAAPAGTLDLTSPEPQFVEGVSHNDDGRGERRGVIVLTPGTEALAVQADGMIVPLETLTIRQSEYTRTENGREAMPAPLPRGIRYTYCAEFSVDEAPDAKAIFFSKPLYYYLDNFLDLPVGTGIPNGVFDRERSEWVGEFDAIVLSLLSVSERIDGTLLAEIDMDGDGLAESAATLYAQLGVTDAEREIIAAKYGPTLSGGAPKTFWRAPMTRFSPRDINLFAGIPSGSIGPVAKADTDETDPNEMDCPSSSTGSSIECESRILGEQLTIPGTPFSLHYRSDHSGRLANRSIMGELLNLVEYLAKDDIAGILIEIQTASAGTYYASRNGSDFTWTWSGKGQNGLPLTGEQRARVTVKYFYRAKYSCPGYTTRGIGFRSVEEARTTLLYGVGSSSGGGDGDSSILGSDVVVCGDAGIQSLDQVFYVKLHNRATNPQGMGGLTLDVNARYDHDSKRLYRGDGLVRQAEYLDQVITTTKGGLSSPEFIRLLPDGSVVFSETIQGTDYKNRIRKLAPNGELTTIAGGGTQLYRDGMAPLDAALYIKSMDTDDKGRIYFADNTRRQVLKIDLDGLLYLVAGSGISCGAPLYLCSGLAGENGPAVNAALVDLEGLAVAPDGALYFGANSSVRKVGTDGVIHSLFSNLRPLPNQYIPNLLRVTKDNTHLLVSGTNCSYYSCRGDLSKINLQGSPTITSLVGGNEQTYFPDLVPEGYGPDIRFYFNYVTAGALSYIMYYQNGTYTAVSGGAIGYSGDNGLARYAQYQYPLHLTINDNGETYVADRTNSVIRKIGSPNASVPAGGYMIADRQTGDILVFDRYGRHLRTLDPVTGVERYRFEYTQSPIADPNYPTGAYVGLTLSKVIDTDGRETLVDRSDPDEVRIISPDGQLSIVELNGQGFASRLIQPDGSSYVFDYTSLREEALLLSKITYPNGRWTEYLYDGDGRLKKVIDQRTTEAAPFKQLISLPTTGKKEMKTWLYTAEKKSLYYRYDNAAGIVTREQTAPDGTVDSSLNTLALAQTTASRNGGDITMTAYETKDQRFGWQMPYVSSQSITTDGLTMTVSRSKTAVLANPVDLFSHTALTDTTTVNGKTWQSTFTKADMKYRATSPLGRISDTFVNAKGRVTLQQGPQIAGTATEPVGYTWATDGKLTAIMQGSGASERRMDITYYPVTDLSSGALKGEIATIVDPLDRTVDFEYDTMGRVTRQIFEKGTADERDILYTYDASGNVLSIAPAGRPEHDFHYNLVDLPDRYSAPQVPGVSPDAVHSHYNYNRDRQLESIVRPDGTTIGMIYDIYKEYEDPGRTYSGKLMKIAVPGRGDIALTYETTGGKKLDSITTPEGNALNYTYTGALLASESWSGAVSGTVSRTYNNDFRVTALTVNGVSAAYTYDNDGLLTGAGDLVVTRDPQSGLVTGTTLGAVTTTQSYNSFGELVAFNADDYAYTLTQRDKLGRITEKTETVEGTTTTYGYEYDAAGRLAKVWENDILQSEYGYDDNGNRLVKNGVSATYDDQDRMLSNGGVVYTYSVNGDLETKTDTLGTTIYDYDALGNLNAVVLPDKTVNYVYDGRNRRIAKSVDGVVTERFIYFGQLRPAAKMNGDGTVAETYIYGTKANVPEYVLRNGNRYRVVTDHLGSVRMVVDVADGTVKQRMQYDEFGIVTEDYSETGFEPLPFGFAGGLYDRDTQLVTFGVREYDPETGRWLEKEPLGFAGAYNFYAYTSSDPVNYTDRNGYWKGSGHEDLTERALDYWGFDFYDIKIVIAANVQTDDLKNLKKGAYHYDPGYEKEAKARLDDLFQKAVDLENRGCHNEAMQVLGSFLHTAQDYYAHSLPNYDFWDHLDPTTAADDPVRLKPLYDAAYLDTIKRVGEFLKRTK
ncbi:MAG TPA: RHS repeat-associated core domain-containing protein [bacterium]|nr:RHS repeat-associated core domain-containing protein [bacterium]